MKATFSSVLKMNCTRGRVSNTVSLEKSQKTSVWVLYGSIISWDILYTLKLVLKCWCERVRLPLRSVWMTEDNDCIAGARRQVDHCRVLRQSNPWITSPPVQDQFQQKKMHATVDAVREYWRKELDNRRVRESRIGRVATRLFYNVCSLHMLKLILVFKHRHQHFRELLGMNATRTRFGFLESRRSGWWPTRSTSSQERKCCGRKCSSSESSTRRWK